jgi:hypothetical protein
MPLLRGFPAANKRTRGVDFLLQTKGHCPLGRTKGWWRDAVAETMLLQLCCSSVAAVACLLHA